MWRARAAPWSDSSRSSAGRAATWRSSAISSASRSGWSRASWRSRARRMSRSSPRASRSTRGRRGGCSPTCSRASARRPTSITPGGGSAANSAVCYALGITAVDPVGMELLFERFLSEARGEWPDIDLDLPSGARREAVIQHVYQRYGRLGAGMTANVITYRGRSAAREVGKALGLPRDMQDRLARFVPNWGYQDAADQLTKHLAEAGGDTRHPRIRHFAALWMRIQDLPRHLGQHSGRTG